jgi:ABC-type taurine transport system substrate-binding protein
MELLLIQYVYPKKEHKQTKKFLLKKNQQTIQNTTKFLFEKKK